MSLVANRPSQRLVDIVGTLRGTWRGNVAMCRCPVHNDHTPSLSLRQGDHGILVTCFAGCSPIDVLRELERIAITRRYEPPPDAPGGRSANVQRLWDEALPVPGTLGERYLASRFLLPVPGDLRFHPRCPHGARPHTVFKPALLVAVREGPRLVALQRIFLDPVTARYSAKATIGTLGFGAWRGGGIGSGGGLAIGLAEGFETARAWSRLRGLPCWASLGSRRFGLVTIPETVTGLILAGDNDTAGRRAVNRAARAYAADNRLIRVDMPPPGKDWAQVLEEQERAGSPDAGRTADGAGTSRTSETQEWREEGKG
ncbi:toprim domain-containing protein [Novosphingobium sp. ST904]|uniref:DUF7146 domain-containing protein n=1 Tax=Novosphingobium sp. ST904 TaxID=1684385 RepID=UPI0009E73ABB|nr:toprim domain-containing protein [Novosphingobium sp. ST904]TCM32346.1 Toprim domain-containing protein [Novosphingobium sp. ST904]